MMEKFVNIFDLYMYVQIMGRENDCGFVIEFNFLIGKD